MPDDKKIFEIDLDSDGSETDLLKDISSAAEAAKQRIASVKAQGVREEKQSNSRKTSMILVAVGAVVILLLSYWIVFAKDGNGAMASGSGTTQVAQTQPSKIAIPSAAKVTPTTPLSSPPVSAVGRDSQVVAQPPDGYEQPNEPGM